MLNLNVVVRDIRSFAGRHIVPVKPLTIIVGENSSGKSTFLAVLSAILDRSGFPFQLALNRPPFELGGFENILTGTPKRSRRAKDFAIGFDRMSGGGTDMQVVATYGGAHGQVRLATFLLKSPFGELEFDAGPRSIKGIVRLRPDEHHAEEVELAIDLDEPVGPQVDLGSLVLMGAFRSGNEQTRKAFLDVQPRLYRLVYSALAEIHQHLCYSLAPIRTRPKRTYDQATDSFTPEGDHIPIVLARIFADESKSDLKAALRTALAKFGSDSGLFKNVGVRRLGLRPNDPFQLRVSMSGRVSNLTDVGYGVSQALPVVVESVLGAESTVLLLQQPEVHLHPKAQAALGTFFVDLASTRQKQFVIETHSDYLVDRVRQEVAAGRFPCHMVSLLFFELVKGVTKVHRIQIDELGNLVNPPKRYREFFLNEQRRLLSRGR